DGVVRVPIEAAGKSEVLEVDRVISAVGIVGNVEDLGLEGTKVKVEKTHVVIDAYCRTGEPGVYAIGDLAGAPWLAHKASHEGVLCVEKIAGLDVHPIDWTNIPGCTYCRPQVASVGWTEAKARAEGREVKVGRFPFIGNGKAIAMGEPEGMVKTVFDAKTGELLGAHMVGAEVTEMIQGYVITRTLEGTETDLMHTVFPHPTVSETMHESVLGAFNQAIHF
ncbi:MAG: FAD-dependent oxidoreductase, partial [Gluconacetobacter diazotrophicus]|nr:FAD-dependent oxidoreductase [Gluconacetobacter diazotrophicus]